MAVAEMLNAQVVTDHLRLSRSQSTAGPEDGTTLRIPSPWSGLFVFSRPDEPFTPAESARANRLAQIAEAALITGPTWAPRPAHPAQAGYVSGKSPGPPAGGDGRAAPGHRTNGAVRRSTSILDGVQYSRLL